MRRLENNPRLEVDVQPRTSWLFPDLKLYDVVVLIPDHMGHQCAVRNFDVWCDDAMLAHVVEAYDLGESPEQLTDAEWLELVAFLTRTEPLANSAAARHIAPYAPAAVMAEIASPRVSRRAEGVEVVFFIERLVAMAYPSGPKELRRVEVLVSPKNVATLNVATVWEGQ